MPYTNSEGPDQHTYIRSKKFICVHVFIAITKTRLFKYIENFTTKKLKTFRWKILVIFIFLFKT